MTGLAQDAPELDEVLRRQQETNREMERREREAVKTIRQRLAQAEEETGGAKLSPAAVKAIIREETAGLPATRRLAVEREITLYLSGALGPLQPLMDNPDVTEIMVNRHNLIFAELGGKMVKTDVRLRDDEEVRSIVERVVSRVGRRFDLSEPIVDARIPEYGARINAVLGPSPSIEGTVVTIRKFPKLFTFQDLVDNETIPEDVAEKLIWAVRNGLNIIVSGGTSSGKTALLNALIGLIPPEVRLVFAEDAAELQPLGHENVVRLEARPPSIEGKGEIDLRTLTRTTLRQRPDRVIVGESRGPEIIDVFTAMNSGHRGSMSTVHANSPEELISRLQTMFLWGANMPVHAINRQIALSLHLIVQVARVQLPDGTVRRMVTHLTAVDGFDEATGAVRLEDIYRRPVEETGFEDVPEWARRFFMGGRAL